MQQPLLGSTLHSAHLERCCSTAQSGGLWPRRSAALVPPGSLAWIMAGGSSRRMELSRTVMEQMTGHQSRVNRVHRLPIPSHGGGEPAAAAGRCWRPWHTHEGGRHGGGKEGRRKAGVGVGGGNPPHREYPAQRNQNHHKSGLFLSLTPPTPAHSPNNQTQTDLLKGRPLSGSP